MKIIILILLILLLVCGNVMAATYFVKNGGNDLADGLSDVTAWATIAKVNGASLVPGDNVLFRRGDTWNTNWTLTGVIGASENHITIGAYGSGDLPQLKCFDTDSTVSYLTIQDIKFRGSEDVGHAVNLCDGHDITFTRCTVISNGVSTDGGGYGNLVQVSGANVASYNINITNNTIDGESLNGGIEADGNSEGIHDIVISGNTIFDCKEIGIEPMGQVGGTAMYNITISDNIISDSVQRDGIAHGINVGWNCYNVVVERNYVSGCSSFGIVVDGGVHDTTIRNNLSINNGNPIGAEGGGGAVYNIYIYNNTLVGGPLTGWNGLNLSITTYGGHDIEFMNNIVVCQDPIGGGNPDYYENGLFTNVTSEYNLYYDMQDVNGPRFYIAGAGGGDYNKITWQALGQDTHSIFQQNPLLVSSSDFHLQPSSVCVNAGVTLASVTDDYEGRARPVGVGYDIGAYEYTGTTLDTIAPSPIIDLSVTGITTSMVFLSWSVPGDDGASGTAASYDVRYNIQIITDSNWGTSTQISTEPTPSSAGTTESMTVSGLTSGRTYYFAMKVFDEVPNTSGLSNVASGSTVAVPDTTPPYTTGYYPVKDAINIITGENIVVHVKDDGTGVDINTIVMCVNGVVVNPMITGTPADYTLTYDPSANFAFGQTVTVTVEVSDLAP